MRCPLLSPGRRPLVFVSSRIDELAKERRAAARLIRDRFKFEAFLFEESSRPYPPRDVYAPYVQRSHFFVGIYGKGYGWIDPSAGMDVSGIHDEWKLAAGAGLPCLVFVKRTAEPREPRLEELLEEIGQSVSYTYFQNTDDLLRLLEDSLLELVHGFILGAQGQRIDRVPDYARELIEQYSSSCIIGTSFSANEILSALKSYSRILIHGAPGSGKTVTMMKLAKEMNGTYVSLRNRSLLEVLSYLANSMSLLAGIEPIPPTSVDEAASRCESFLRTASRLLLIDDVDQNREVGAFLSRMPPGRGRIVFAGRVPESQLRENATTLECRGFTPDEASEYVSKALPHADEELRRKAIRLSRGNPLYLSYYCKSAEEEPAVSLTEYHGRIWQRLNVEAQELLAVVSLAVKPLSYDELSTAAGKYRGSPISSVRIEREAHGLEGLVAVSHGTVSVFHPAFREYVADLLQARGISSRVHRALSHAHGGRDRLHLAVYHLLKAGDTESVYADLQEAEVQAYLNGQVVVARTLLAADIAISRKRGDIARVGRALLQAAEIRRDTTSLRSALKTARLAERTLKAANEDEWVMFAQGAIATWLVQLGRGEEAVGTLTTLVEHWHRNGMPREEALMRTNLGYVYAKLGRFDECEFECLEAMKLHASHGNKYGYALSMVNLSNVYSARHDNEQLLATSRKLKRLSLELRSPRLEAAVYNGLTAYYRRKGQHDRAESAARKAISIAESLEDWDCVATNLCNLGNVLREQKAFDDAEECYKKAESIGISKDSLGHVAMARSLMAALAEDKGDVSTAIQFGGDAIRLWKQVPNAFRVGDEHRDQASRHLSLSKWRDAIEHYQLSAEHFLRSGLAADAASCLDRGIELYLDRFDKLNAAALYERALSMLATPSGVASLSCLLRSLQNWGPRFGRLVGIENLCEKALASLSPSLAKQEVLELVRSTSVAVKSLDQDCAPEYLRFLEGLVDSYLREPCEHILTGLAIGMSQAPPSVDADALTRLCQKIGSLRGDLVFRHEEELGDQWLVVLAGPNAPIVDISTKFPCTLNERLVAATAATLLCRQKVPLEQAIAAAGWKTIGWEVFTASEADCQQHGLPRPTDLSKLGVCLTMAADRTEAAEFPTAMFVSDTYLSEADLTRHPGNRYILALNWQLVGECIDHFSGGRLPSRELVRAKRRILVASLDIHYGRRGRAQIST